MKWIAKVGAIVIAASFTTVPHQAATAMPVVKPAIPAEVLAADTLATPVQRRVRRNYRKRRGYRARRVRPRRYYRNRRYGRRGYYRPPYYWGPYYDRPYYGYSRSRAHVRWCYRRYRSYRAWDNTYQPYRGPRRQCISPYS